VVNSGGKVNELVSNRARACLFGVWSLGFGVAEAHLLHLSSRTSLPKVGEVRDLRGIVLYDNAGLSDPSVASSFGMTSWEGRHRDDIVTGRDLQKKN